MSNHFGIATTILSALRRGESGATVDTSGVAVSASGGYVVALAGHEQRITLDLSWGLDCQRDNVLRLACYSISVDRVLADGFPRRHVGAWRDGRETVLDVVEVFESRETAERVGRHNGQTAIFDLSTREDIYL